jgi:hypothetical protein
MKIGRFSFLVYMEIILRNANILCHIYQQIINKVNLGAK